MLGKNITEIALPSAVKATFVFGDRPEWGSLSTKPFFSSLSITYVILPLGIEKVSLISGWAADLYDKETPVWNVSALSSYLSISRFRLPKNALVILRNTPRQP